MTPRLFLICITMSLFMHACSPDTGTISLTWAMPEQLVDISREFARMYMEVNQNVSVIVHPLPSEIESRKKSFETLFKNRTVDIVTIDTHMLDFFLSEHYTAPIKMRHLEYPPEDYFKGITNTCRLNTTTLYALPWIADTNALFYRQDLLIKADALPPKTWRDVIAVSEDIISNNPGISGFLCGGKTPLMLSTLFIESLWSSGLDVATEDGDLMLELPQVIALLKQWKQNVKNKIFPNLSDLTHTEALRKFQEGGSLFYYGPLSDWKELDDPYKKNGEKISFLFTTIPSVTDYHNVSILDAYFLALCVHTRHTNASLEFMKFLGSFSSQEVLLMNDYIPAMKNIFKKSEVAEYKPHGDHMSSLLDNAEPIPFHRITPVMLTIIDEHITKIFKEKINPAEAMYLAAQKIRNLPRARASSDKTPKKPPVAPAVSVPKKEPAVVSQPVTSSQPEPTTEPPEVPAPKNEADLISQPDPPLQPESTTESPSSVSGLSPLTEPLPLTGLNDIILTPPSTVQAPIHEEK